MTNTPHAPIPTDAYRGIDTERLRSFSGFLDDQDARSLQSLVAVLREDIRVPQPVSIPHTDDRWDNLRYYLHRYLRAAQRSQADASNSAYAHLIATTMIQHEEVHCTNGVDLHVALQAITIAGSLIGGRCAAASLATINIAAINCLAREGVPVDHLDATGLVPWPAITPPDPDGNAAIFCARRPFCTPILLVACARACFERIEPEPSDLTQPDGSEDFEFLLPWSSLTDRTATDAAELAHRACEHDRT